MMISCGHMRPIIAIYAACKAFRGFPAGVWHARQEVPRLAACLGAAPAGPNYLNSKDTVKSNQRDFVSLHVCTWVNRLTI